MFDMDGLLVESESRWRQAETEVAASVGLALSRADLEATMGMRMREVAQRWFERQPWTGPGTDEVADRVVDRVIELTEGAVPLPGVLDTLDLCADRELRLAVCSSSDVRLIDATLERLGIAGRFEVVHSAEDDPHGKPHPEPYLRTAARLGVSARACVAFEDSVSGAISARAASMRVVAVPDPDADRARFGFCDLVLASLRDFTASHLTALGAPGR